MIPIHIAELYFLDIKSDSMKLILTNKKLGRTLSTETISKKSALATIINLELTSLSVNSLILNEFKNNEIITSLLFLLAFNDETKNQRGHPLENSGQAGSCVFLIFLFKNQVFLLFKLNLNMTTHLVMTSIGVNMHQSPI